MDQRKTVQPAEKPENADKTIGTEGTRLAAQNDAMRQNRQIAEPAYRNGDDRQLRTRSAEPYTEPPALRPVLDERAVANVERLLREHASLVHEIE
jgi:hypothetical protein